MNPSSTNATETQKSPTAETKRQEPKSEAPKRSAGRKRAFLIFFLVLLVIAIGGGLYWQHAREFEETDDAFVEMHINPVSPRIDGVITKVYVDNNRTVQAGDPLVDLDPRDFQVDIDRAEASLAQARSQVIGQQPNIPITQVENATNISAGEANAANARAALAASEHDRDSAAAKLAAAEADNAKAQADLGRYKILIAHEEVSQQEYDQIAAMAASQAANVNANRSALASAAQMIDQRKAQLQESESRLEQYRNIAAHQIAIRQAAVRSQEANSKMAAAESEQARLNLAYTKIVAPVGGIVMQRSAEVGARVAAGQQLLSIANTSDLWVTANFKETQLARLHPGQTARIHVDALNRDFDGYIEDVAGGTGAVTSVLPPENATGNYVKVVQRIPVRLRFKQGQDGLNRLRAGMSVEPEVRAGN